MWLRLSSFAVLSFALALGCSAAPQGSLDASTHDAGSADVDVPDAPVPDARASDRGLDAASALDADDLDASDAASELDASDLDASDAASEDATAESDAMIDLDASGDAGPVDGGIVRTTDPATHPAAPPIAPFAECTVITASDVVSGSEHRVPCDPIDYPFSPPSSGPHYSQWAAFEAYTAPVPWGFLVHAMEHGAVVLSYHCATDADCDAVRAAFATIVTERGLDDVCRDEDTPQRIIIAPDPTLTTPIAATAWGHVYTATCLDLPSLRAFIDAHYAMAPENFCFPGVDRSATGWCP